MAAKSAMTINDGKVIRKDELVLAIGNGKGGSVVKFHLGKTIKSFEVKDDEVVSVAVHGDLAYVVGALGSVFELPLKKNSSSDQFNKNVRSWVIESAVKFGELTRVKVVGNDIFICGSRGQVYKLKGNEWIQFTFGPAKEIFEDVAGNSAREIYAISGKKIFWFNGKTWKEVFKSKTGNLSSIVSTDYGNFFVCGDEKTLLRGRKDKWAELNDSLEKESYWDLAIVEDQIYMSSSKGIDLLSGHAIKPMKIPIKTKGSFHRLAVSESGDVYSFGLSDVLKFDGSKWSKVKLK